MIKIHCFIFNPFEENTYLLVDQATNDAAVVDPGMFTQDDIRVFDDFIKEHGINLRQVINTHMHVDHCFGDNYVRDKYGVKVAANLGDDYYAASLEVQARRFGMQRTMRPVEIDAPLEDGDTIMVGQTPLTVIHVPGHSQGGIALYDKEGKWVISGDSLFRGSIGRTDFQGGNHSQLVSSVRNKLLSLPGDTMVLPGHGPTTTIDYEKAHNPYI
ncbi:MAG: MBL fold metallo-hydrolase [Muribaculaceae bacterium]